MNMIPMLGATLLIRQSTINANQHQLNMNALRTRRLVGLVGVGKPPIIPTEEIKKPRDWERIFYIAVGYGMALCGIGCIWLALELHLRARG